MSKLSRIGEKIDNRAFGLLFGFIFPIITFLILWQLKFSAYSLKDLFKIILSNPSKRNILIFPLLPNLLLFYLTNFRFRLNRFTMGVVAITILYTFIIAVLIIL